MNETTAAPTLIDNSLFVAYEKSLLAAVVPLVVMAVGIGMYKRVRREPESESNATPFYLVSAGIIWGLFFMHMLPNAITHGVLGYKFRILFFALGYYCMLGYERFSRTSHPNKNFVGRPATGRVAPGDEGDYIDMNASESGENYWNASEDGTMLYRRRVLAHIYYIVQTGTSLVDGLFLVYNAQYTDRGLLIALYALRKILQSVALFTVLIYARMYTLRGYGKRWFFTLLLGWPIVVFFSTVLVLAEVDGETASLWINHVALGIAYSFSAGVFLWYANHFEHVELESPTRTQLRLSFVLFVVMSLSVWILVFFN